MEVSVSDLRRVQNGACSQFWVGSASEYGSWRGAI